MANRSYLYSANVVPSAENRAERKLVGIAEWNYDIPIVFKLLLSGNPKSCRSSIWDVPDDIALVGEYALGFQRLKEFAQEIQSPAAKPLIDKAIEFLSQPMNQAEYFVMECGEIFEMESTPLHEQNFALLKEIQNLEPQITKALESLRTQPIEARKQPGFVARLFGAKPVPSKPDHDPMKAIYALGLGNWSNILYFDFSNA